MLDSPLVRRVFESCVLSLGVWSFLTILFIYRGDYTIESMLYFQLFGWTVTAIVVTMITFSLGKRVLSSLLIFVAYLLVGPFMVANKYPFLSKSAEHVTLFVVYLLVIWERYIRWILSYFVGHHNATGKNFLDIF